jgi:hypothetical protein
VEFKSTSRQPLEVTIDGKVINITKPKIGAMRAFQEAVAKQDPSQMFNVIVEFGKSMGLPEDIVNNWDIDQMSEFLEFVSQQKKS